MSAIGEALRLELSDPEYSEGYAESFLNSFIATQIKVLREKIRCSCTPVSASKGYSRQKRGESPEGRFGGLTAENPAIFGDNAAVDAGFFVPGAASYLPCLLSRPRRFEAAW